MFARKSLAVLAALVALSAQAKDIVGSSFEKIELLRVISSCDKDRTLVRAYRYGPNDHYFATIFSTEGTARMFVIRIASDVPPMFHRIDQGGILADISRTEHEAALRKEMPNLWAFYQHKPSDCRANVIPMRGE